MLHGLSSVPAVLIVLAAGSAEARGSRHEARLRACGPATCVILTGDRADGVVPVTVAGHPVVVEGDRRFQVALPVETVRAWSAPFARSIAVTTTAPNGKVTTREVRLPIGLLGQATELAALEVTAR